MLIKRVFILGFLLGVYADFPGFENQRYPSCNIVDVKSPKGSRSRHAIHKCKTKAGDFKCSEIVLDNCVAVDNKKGNIFVRGSGSDPEYKTLAANCPVCSYYGYSMTLHCLCAGGDRPTLYEPTSLELKDFFTNNDGILGNNHDSTHRCVAREVKCPGM